MRRFPRLEQAVRAAGMVAHAPRTEAEPLREGVAGGVPMRLFERADGTLVIRAEFPNPMPPGLEAWLSESGTPELNAKDPLAARLLLEGEEVLLALKALFTVAPGALINDKALILEVAPEADVERLERSVMAALLAVRVLARSSREPLEPAPASRTSRVAELAEETLQLLRRSLDEDEARDFARGKVEDPHVAGMVFSRALQAHNAEVRRQGALYLLAGGGLGGICRWLLRQDFDGFLLLAAAFAALATVCGLKGLGRLILGGWLVRTRKPLDGGD